MAPLFFILPRAAGEGDRALRGGGGTRIDTTCQRPTLTPFRGELRQGAERPQAFVRIRTARRRGDPSNLIRVMPAKGRNPSTRTFGSCCPALPRAGDSAERKAHGAA
jgi:hypothetical protein